MTSKIFFPPKLDMSGSVTDTVTTTGPTLLDSLTMGDGPSVSMETSLPQATHHGQPQYSYATLDSQSTNVVWTRPHFRR